MTQRFPLRIVLIGAECTGKTTLSSALSGNFAEPFSPEFVREYVNQLDRPLSASDLDPIAVGQLNAEDEAAARAREIVFHDTNLLSTLIYARRYFGVDQEWLERALQQRHYSHYFLCEPDFPWVADPGQREGPAVRSQLQEIFRHELIRRALPFTCVSGPLPDRIESVRSHLSKIGLVNFSKNTLDATPPD